MGLLTEVVVVLDAGRRARLGDVVSARAAVRVVDRVTEAGRARTLAAKYGAICVAWANELRRACRVLFR